MPKPCLPPEKRREDFVRIGLTKKERRLIERVAAKLGLAAASWARMVVIKAIGEKDDTPTSAAA